MLKVKQNNFKEKHIFIGIDVHKKSWMVSILCEDIEHTTKQMQPSAKLLGKYLRKNFPGAYYHSVYEAGFCGFWIHEALTAEGVDNIIVNPADVPTTDRDRKHKTDVIDSRKLAKSLRNKELKCINIPDKEKQYLRSFVRLRSFFVKDQTRIKNRIKSHLALYGIDIDEEFIGKHWSKLYIEHLKNIFIEKNYGILSHTMALLINQLESQRTLVSAAIREIRKIASESKYVEDVENLVTVPGVSTITSMTLITEIGDLEIYKSLSNLVSYFGLIPNESSSGEKENKLSITKRGNTNLKYVIIEAAWVAIRKDPELMRCYLQYITKMKKSKAIVKIARKLINRIRYVLLNKQPYKLLENETTVSRTAKELKKLMKKETMKSQIME